MFLSQPQGEFRQLWSCQLAPALDGCLCVTPVAATKAAGQGSPHYLCIVQPTSSKKSCVRACVLGRACGWGHLRALQACSSPWPHTSQCLTSIQALLCAGCLPGWPGPSAHTDFVTLTPTQSLHASHCVWGPPEGDRQAQWKKETEMSPAWETFSYLPPKLVCDPPWYPPESGWVRTQAVTSESCLLYVFVRECHQQVVMVLAHE